MGDIIIIKMPMDDLPGENLSPNEVYLIDFMVYFKREFHSHHSRYPSVQYSGSKAPAHVDNGLSSVTLTHLKLPYGCSPPTFP